MYTVNDKTFDSYMKAVAYAEEVAADVIQTDNGMRRWTPPAAVTKKAKRRYAEHKAVYDIQKATN